MPETTSSPDNSGSPFDPYTSDVTMEKTHSHQQSNGSAFDLNTASSQQHPPEAGMTIGHASNLQSPISRHFPGQKANNYNAQVKKVRKRKRPTSDLDKSPGSSEYSERRDGMPNMALSRESNAAAIPQASFKRVKSIEVNGPYSPPTEEIHASGTVSFGSMLPGEIWQHIFTFLPPTSLGKLLCVNRTFRSLLTPSETELSSFPQASGLLKYLNPNSIWSISRRAFHPGMPRPMSLQTELEMWKLIYGSNCQFCGKLSSCSSSTDSTIWEAGPGLDGVRIIWPFGIRSCGECVQVESQKEMDLLFSSNLPSMLIPSLPFAFFTSSMHFTSSVILRNNQPPGNISLTKYFYKAHVDDMRRKFEDVKLLGPAATEEWIKGLECNGKDKLADAARWEQWEASGGIRSIRFTRGTLNGAPLQVSSADSGAKNEAIDTTFGHSGHSSPLTNGRATDDQGSPATVSSTSGSKLPLRPLSRDSSQPLPSSSSAHHPRTERSLREVNEAKASRKAEIERRCLDLVPPLTPAVLSHMDSFSAAIQIPHPFTDRDWDILKPRLLSQRDVAERRELERVKQDQIFQAKSEERRQQDAQFKEAKEQLDREWDEAQKPIRDRMALYADEIIREGWRGGDAVTKEKSAKFAADVLIYVKDKFYRDLAQEDAKARNAGKPIPEDPPGAPPTRKLILENMKFIFDTKIKPLTEQFQKELFLCNGNGCEANTKFYGFEGVIQHYAAKHTNVLSLGSVVVHWRAEWPEHSPFHPNPTAAKALFFAMPRPIVGHNLGYPNQPHGPMYMSGPDQGHHHLPDGGPGYPQPSPGPYNRTPFGTPYAYGSGPYRPPSPPPPPFYPNQSANFAYSAPQPGYPPSGAYDPYGPPQAPNPVYGSPYPGQAYPPPYPPPPDSRAAQPYQPPPYPPPAAGQPPFGAPYPANSHPTRRSGTQGHNSNPNSQAFGIYQTQLDDIAKNARSIWNGTSGIKDLPHNVRAHVLIHHVVSRFVEKFGNEPPLTLFADGLSSHAQMKPIKNLSGLVCKACNDAEISGRHHRHDVGRTDRKIYTLPALVSHFQSMHLDRPKSIAPHPGPEPRRLEWQYDMLLVPDNQTVSELVDAPGMDDTKMQLVSAAFPWVFPHVTSTSHTPASNVSGKRRPEPRDSKQPNRAYTTNARPKFAEQNTTGTNPNLPNPNHGLEVAVDDFPRFVESPVTDNNKPADPPKDDEYDPHKPAFVEPIRDQHGRVDTRRPRQNQPSTISSKERPHNPRAQDQTHGNRYPPGTKFQRGQPSDVDRAKSNPYADRHQHNISKPSSKPSSQYRDRPPKSIHANSSVTAESSNEFHKNRTPVKSVSEDGEVEEAGHPQEHCLAAGISLHEEMTDAERFLSSFVPGQENEEYKKVPSRGSERRPDEAPRSKWLEGTELNDRRWRIDGGSGGTAESSVSGTPTRSKQHSWNRATSPTIEGFREYEPKREHYASSRHGEERSPEPTDVRHGRKGISFSESRHQSDYHARRPHSRFDRYEAQRQGSHRPRSRSPIARDSLPVESTYYRDRSPVPPRTRQRPVYAGHASDPYYDRAAADQNVAYARLHPRGTYQYVEEQRYVEPPYDGAVEYIPVRVGGREHQNNGAYYIERSVQREVPKEYVDYEVDYPRQPGLVESHNQYYPGESASSNTVPRHPRYR
ncbi:hypothetical protein I7I50_07403 [Histoplasma capsulatum G186AR]|uniref:F-box domain-containing protein n=1 Tax=Ajellomyces capsulatus TaxID=5037 RepID=A0A8H8D2K0_AJECA|nr:hypothetical protein I7I52_09525 [Histoplasma capsulatum]QSS68110.1 hypothetical protein I7I50_07403 [Histoplasma capsulatum G186AR]